MPASDPPSTSPHSKQSAPPRRKVEYIVSLCNDPDSGGRIIDHIITNTLLPALSREFLKRSLAKEELKEARVTIADRAFAYAWG
jgi:type VI secretion system protein VasG